MVRASYKTQVISLEKKSTVLKYFKKTIPQALEDDFFIKEVLNPLKIPELYHAKVCNKLIFSNHWFSIFMDSLAA